MQHLNLIHSVTTAAISDIAEVMVCMFGPTSDMYGLLHRGTRVRKMHSSYRSTFRTIGDIPIATVSREKVTPIRDDYKRRRFDNDVKVNAVFDDRVAIVYYYPNMKPDMIDSLIDNGYKGIVIAGTGLGHVNKPLYPALKACKRKRCCGLYDGSNTLGLCANVCLRYRQRYDGTWCYSCCKHACPKLLI
ncbi:MAG: asparaginase domain-containing protein [Ignavibacteriales bacterium]|nr:asparaginase domain-containing protein [Ignavibacteriales bacterium]